MKMSKKTSSVSTSANEDSKDDASNIQKRKLESRSILEKLNILYELENSTYKSISEKYDIPRRTLRNWVMNKDRLQQQANTYHLTADKKRIKTSPLEEVDEALYTWFDTSVKSGVVLSGPLIKEKAKELHGELKIDKPFSASEGWLDRWKKKYNIQNFGGRCDDKIFAEPIIHHITSDQAVFSAELLITFFERHPVLSDSDLLSFQKAKEAAIKLAIS